MDDAVNVGVGLEDLIEGGLVGDIQLSELGLLAGDQLDALEGLGGGIGQVVGDDDLVASVEEGEGGEGADIARSTDRRGVRSITEGLQWSRDLPGDKNRPSRHDERQLGCNWEDGGRGVSRRRRRGVEKEEAEEEDPSR